ncbi:hypothetical protein [Paraburkholderia susongensis]|uniref:Uncharacterized protein n=1 Tax=Paraburkholderia susongensis TaxID=1515439 RepID=A0A1X7J0T3_9BURK|nr:hypothetical protein [Paraburkholderia susongensis]SMG20933.1 hypothetical protein SAMN06265784_10228 [Paraburkholderia susongensis]
MSQSVFEMHSVELFCQRPLGARYVICDEWHYEAALRKAAYLGKARAETQEFLSISQLNRREWERDLDLLRSIMKRHWLTFHDVRDRNPDTDGWWIINALLAEVRRGSLLAVKGPRADLFPPPDSTPLRRLAARSVQYDPATWQAQLRAARAAKAGGSSGEGLPDAAATVVGTQVGDRHASTSLADAAPFEMGDSVSRGNVLTMAVRGVSEAEEAECDAMYEARMTYCSALSKMYGGDARTYLACKQQAFADYQACRGY